MTGLEHSCLGPYGLCLHKAVRAVRNSLGERKLWWSEAQVVKPPRFNAYYGVEDVDRVDGATWKLERVGRIADKKPDRAAILHAAGAGMDHPAYLR